MGSLPVFDSGRQNVSAEELASPARELDKRLYGQVFEASF
jgi:hypothetical protein